MQNNQVYDVIIVGGGPAGLSVGSEVSEELNILVVDKKEKISETTRSWFVPSFTAKNNPDVNEFMYEGVKRFLTNTFTRTKKTAWDGRLNGGYSYVKEHEILKYWANIIKENGSKIELGCLYRDHIIEDGIVKVNTSKGVFTAKLLIDASGHDSHILKKYEKDNNYYWWSVFGCLAEHPNGINDMQVGDYMLWQTFEDTNIKEEASLREGRPVFEYEILNEDTSFPLILYLRKEKVSYDLMKEEFMHVLREENSTKDFHDVEIKELKYGWYPSGDLSQQIAEDRVSFIGDAGCWTTPCGWGFAFILDNYKRYSDKLITKVKEDSLTKKSLMELTDFESYDKYQILFNALATHFLSNASASQLDRFIAFFDEIDTLLCEKLFTLTATPEEVMKALYKFVEYVSLKELFEIFPKEDYPLILQEAKYFLEILITEKAKDLKSIFSKQEVKSNLKSGFRFD